VYASEIDRRPSHLCLYMAEESVEKLRIEFIFSDLYKNEPHHRISIPPVVDTYGMIATIAALLHFHPDKEP